MEQKQVLNSIQLSHEGEVNSGVVINRDAKPRGIYLALFTDPEMDSCFSIYQISWKTWKKKLLFGKLTTSLSRNFIYNLQTFRGILISTFLPFCCKCGMKIFFCPPVDTDKPKFVAFLLFVCTTSLFIAQISSLENVSKLDAILAPVSKQ